MVNYLDLVNKAKLELESKHDLVVLAHGESSCAMIQVKNKSQRAGTGWLSISSWEDNFETRLELLIKHGYNP